MRTSQNKDFALLTEVQPHLLPLCVQGAAYRLRHVEKRERTEKREPGTGRPLFSSCFPGPPALSSVVQPVAAWTTPQMNTWHQSR